MAHYDKNKVIFKICVSYWIFKKVESVPSGIAPKLDIASTNMNAKGWCFRTSSATFIKMKSNSSATFINIT